MSELLRILMVEDLATDYTAKSHGLHQRIFSTTESALAWLAEEDPEMAAPNP